MGSDSAGLPDAVEPVSPISIRHGFKYIGTACCEKIRLVNWNGIVVGACPDHSPIIIRDGDIIRGALHG